MSHLVCLSRGHVGTGTRPSATFGKLVEDLIALDYMQATERRLRGFGVANVVHLSGFPYPDQHRRSRELSADVFVSCHVNAGGHGYGAAFYRRGDVKGRRVAEAVAAELRKLEELSADRYGAAGRAIAVDNVSGWQANVYSTIANAPDGAICFEPGFIDNPAHLPLWSDGGTKVGNALSRGICNALR